MQADHKVWTATSTVNPEADYVKKEIDFTAKIDNNE